ncbi:MAG: RnfABCDGE type electron transport complex subunit B [Candidatus Eisenbacteria sp.]|nr:RnfABCDGE type electron transport complex subunit B [Candidatus Eisenbacteria bacterium]
MPTMFSLALLAGGYLVSTPLLLLLIGLFFAIMLTIAHHRLRVEEDPTVVALIEALPGANCGGCGLPGCPQFAEAIAEGRAQPSDCVAASEETIKAVAEILGVEATAGVPRRAVIHCGAKFRERLRRPDYIGVATCTEMNMVAGVQGCTYGCLGLGDCARSCPFEAITMVAGLPVVNYRTCTGCGQCIEACPRGIITVEEMIDDPLLVIACSSQDAGKQVRANCSVGCIACGVCAKLDPETCEVPANLCTVKYSAERYGRTGDHEPAVEKCPTSCLLLVGAGIEDPHELVERKTREKVARAAARAAQQQRIAASSASNDAPKPGAAVDADAPSGKEDTQ